AAIAWTLDRVLAITGGLALGVFLYFYFFGKRTDAAVARSSPTGPQEVEIEVAGGYSPDLVVARRGTPLRLVFDRKESNPCTDEIVLPEFGIRRALEPHARTVIEVVPQRTGEFPFSCGMNMLHGKIRVVEG
ncbi:MAG TPA: cupredoxin domain-containing protein, partial [Thermoanaerobaculia bacterium]